MLDFFVSSLEISIFLEYFYLLEMFGVLVKFQQLHNTSSMHDRRFPHRWLFFTKNHRFCLRRCSKNRKIEQKLYRRGGSGKLTYSKQFWSHWYRGWTDFLECGWKKHIIQNFSCGSPIYHSRLDECFEIHLHWGDWLNGWVNALELNLIHMSLIKFTCWLNICWHLNVISVEF